MTGQKGTGRVIPRYSEAFKAQIVKEIETGKHTIASSMRAYDIKGAETISLWMKKMGKLGLLNKVVRIQMPKEKDKITKLNQEIKQLKEAVVQMQIKQLRTDCDLEVAMEMLGYGDVELFKKKLEELQSKKR